MRKSVAVRARTDRRVRRAGRPAHGFAEAPWRVWKAARDEFGEGDVACRIVEEMPYFVDNGGPRPHRTSLRKIAAQARMTVAEEVSALFAMEAAGGLLWDTGSQTATLTLPGDGGHGG
ncbi:hypothetical protein Psi01_57070 [Planobispora siamensis]|uniref:Uncharacterized protein n=1 Tax=Planobispora siamensis TaxID=936338 RepID=A0A8J3SIT4_9ACTN|nr:hypothetical protein Psi01_57070 [Planobispora siamensis]